MKLYTKEMFLKAAEKCEVSMIDAKHIMQYIDEYVTPIKLPTNEEIEKKAPFSKSTFGFEQGQYQGFIVGAKWMRDKIKGGEYDR